MKVQDLKYVYFLGIGGIGMSALARWFKDCGIPVGGYDKTQTPLTTALASEGIYVTYVDSEEVVPEIVKRNEDVLVVYTPAIPRGSIQKKYFENNGFELKKRAEVLGFITKSFKTLAVAGTHGKTTTSSMLAHILKHAGLNVTGFLGGITKNYNTNLIYDPSNQGEQIVVVEADEFDRSFLHLSPDLIIVTATDADHLDIYHNQDEFSEAFVEFVSKLPSQNLLLQNNKVDIELDVNQNVVKKVYGLGVGSIQAQNICVIDGYQYFDYVTDEVTITSIKMFVPGLHNIENSLAAMSAALSIGISADLVKSGIESYLGVKRRFEYHVRKDNVVYIDDYAHHPTEINAFISSVEQLYPGKKVALFFQPHLFSRTRDFMKGFVEALSRVDELYLMPIYPARELPIPGVTSEVLLEQITSKNKTIVTDTTIEDAVKNTNADVVVTLGAGDIDRFINSFTNIISNK